MSLERAQRPLLLGEHARETDQVWRSSGISGSGTYFGEFNVVVLRYFAGLSVEEAAEVLELSVRAVDARFEFTRDEQGP